MADERTEEATPKRKDKARGEGQIAKSQDFDSAVMLTVGMTLLFLYTPFILDRILFTMKYTFIHLQPWHINPDNFVGLFVPYMNTLAVILLPFLLLLMVTGIILKRSQVGSLITWKAIQPKLDKFSPMKMVESLKNTINPFQPKKLVELLKSFLKLAVVAAFVYSTVDGRKEEILTLLGADVSLSFATIVSILRDIVVNMCIVLIVIGIIDKKYQEYEFNKSIKMTKQEVKDEFKNSQGDPIIKSKLKAAQFKFAQQRMMSKVPKANVVVTNPTHYAVALSYDVSVAPAPQVVAKGVDYVAFKIKEIAENNGVPIVENKPLARTLYKIVPLEGLIPAELYVTVAEVMAFVYKQNQGR